MDLEKKTNAELIHQNVFDTFVPDIWIALLTDSP